MTGSEVEYFFFEPQQGAAEPQEETAPGVVPEDDSVDRFIFKDPVPIDLLFRKLLNGEQR